MRKRNTLLGYVAVAGFLTALQVPLALTLTAADVHAGDASPQAHTAMAALDYQRARHHPIHSKPAIDSADDGACLACHTEILGNHVRPQSPAGIHANDTRAWYQSLSTYDGPQLTFHQRHLSTDYARTVMNLKCNFCHQGNDPREEAPSLSEASASEPTFTLRKHVNPEQTCLLCHGAMPDPKIMGLPGPWTEARAMFENEHQPNGCLVCHATAFRTRRHEVSYLNAAAIEDLAEASSDVCYGCHGGRAWYRIAYPYARTPWPGMADETPAWARDRPTHSAARYRRDVSE